MQQLLSFLLILISSVSWAQSPLQPYTLQISEPRAFGYTLGDTVTRTLRLQLSASYQLISDSLPTAGRVDLWLELDPPQLSIDDTPSDSNNASKHYLIVLTYRLINLADATQLISIPAHTLSINDGTMDWRIPVPEFDVTAHQLAANPAEGSLPNVQGLTPPPLLSLTHYWRWLGTAAVLAVLGLLGLVWMYGLLPWSQRASRPFARAYQQLKREPKTSEVALRTLHQAFNATAGTTVFGRDLDNFFSTQPHFATLRQPIETFFAYSRQQFFEINDTLPMVDILTLARQLRAAERRQN